MEINVQSIKFDADQKLLAFVDKKLSKVEKFHEGIGKLEVRLSLLNEDLNKNVKIIASVPGSQVVVERNAKTFEDAINDCADILKEKLTRLKEKMTE